MQKNHFPIQNFNTSEEELIDEVLGSIPPIGGIPFGDIYTAVDFFTDPEFGTLKDLGLSAYFKSKYAKNNPFAKNAENALNVLAALDILETKRNWNSAEKQEIEMFVYLNNGQSDLSFLYHSIVNNDFQFYDDYSSYTAEPIQYIDSFQIITK